MEEIWRDIQWYEWLYQISNLWIVKRNKYISYCKYLWWYSRVQLHLNWKRKNYFIHRLVAKHFIPNPNNLPFVCHKDETLDENWMLYNWADNLFWGTHSDNMQDMYNKWRDNNIFIRNHPFRWKFWKDHFNSKPINQYSKDWEFIREWDSAYIIETTISINSASIAKCCKWKRKTAWWFKWSYTNITQ